MTDVTGAAGGGAVWKENLVPKTSGKEGKKETKIVLETLGLKDKTLSGLRKLGIKKWQAVTFEKGEHQKVYITVSGLKKLGLNNEQIKHVVQEKSEIKRTLELNHAIFENKLRGATDESLQNLKQEALEYAKQGDVAYLVLYVCKETNADKILDALQCLEDRNLQREFLFEVADVLSEEVLQAISNKLEQDSELKPFLENVIFASKQLSQVEKTQHRLEFKDMVKIAIFAESKFESLSKEEKLKLYLSKKDTGLARSIVIDFESKSIIVLSKKHGDIRGFGATKKVTSAVTVPFRQNSANAGQVQGEARSWARLVNRSGRIIEKREIELARRFSDDVHLVIQYQSSKNPNVLKTTIIEERCDRDLSVHTVFAEQPREKLTEEQVGKVCCGICRSLFKMHGEDFAHKDIKFENVMMSNGQAKLKDFGFSHGVAGDSAKHYPMYPGLENGYGTKCYTAPEVLGKYKLPDKSAQAKAEDMYAMGCLLYELIADGATPWNSAVDGVFYRNENRQTAVNAQIQGYNKILAESGNEKNPKRKALLEICAALVHPVPSERMTIEQFMSRLCQLDPDTAVEMFVTSGYLEKYAADHPESVEKILQLFSNEEFKQEALKKDPELLNKVHNLYSLAK